MTQLTGRVRPKLKADGTEVWVADYRDPRTGKRRQLEAATEGAARALIDVAYGRAPVSADSPCEGYPLGAAVSALLRRSDGLQSLDKLTENCKRILEYFGDSQALELITFHMVEDWMRHMRLRRKNKPSTIRERLKVLKQLRDYALLRGDVGELPPLPPPPEVQNTKERVFSEEEKAQYLEHLYRHYPSSGAVLELMFETCSRFAQINRLTPRWVQVDPVRPGADSTLTFPAAIEKNKRPRTIPLTARAVEVLAEWCAGKGQDELIFGINPQTHKRRLWRTKQALGIKDPLLTGHCARHTAATKLAAGNVSLPVLMRYGGWTSMSSCSRYIHADTEALKTARDALA